MNVCFLLWVVTTQCVNFAFYLVITRAAYGWVRTVGVYLLYTACTVAPACYAGPFACDSVQHMERNVVLSFLTFYCLWCLMTVGMSRGVLGRRILSVLVCGVHQIGAFVLSLLFLLHVRPEWLGASLGCAVMALMGWMLAGHSLPRIRHMADGAGWHYMNISAVANFTLLFSTGFFPTFAATDSWEHVALFAVANVVAITYFPVMIAFAEKGRSDAMLALVENNMQLMANEMRVRRGAIDEARRIRHDQRHHRIVLGGMLLNGKVKEALAYLKEMDEQQDAAPVSKLVWCENETVNAILSGYSRRALAAKVRFSAVANVGRQCGLTDVEIVALVANIVENAIFAAGDGGEVTCKIRQREDSFGLTVTNTVAPDFAFSPKGMPCAKCGIGLASVQRVIDKHHGEIHYALENCVLTCESVIFAGGGGDLNDDSAMR